MKNAALTIDLAPDALAVLQRAARATGRSPEEFVRATVEEKLAMVAADEFFADYRRNARREDFSTLLRNAGNEPPRPGDELPPGWEPADGR